MKYRTKDGQDYTLPGIGRTINGIIVTDKIIENANFELVEETPEVAEQPTAQPAPQVETAPASQAAILPPQPTAPVQPAPPTNQGSDI